jgi:hypothetical protein
LRQLLAKADVVLIGIGGADLNAGDDGLAAGACTGRACYAGILQGYDANIAAIAGEVRRLAPHALLRAITLPNVFPFNGKTADANAYATGLMTKAPCCYPSAEAQQLIARMLLATGVPPRPARR